MLCTCAAADDAIEDGPNDDDDEEAKVDPARALEAIVSAERELVVMHDLTKNIENLRTVSVQYVDRALTEREKLLVTATAVERRKRDLTAASARLRAVAKQMRAEVEQDRVFIQSLSDLQVLGPENCSTIDSEFLIHQWLQHRSTCCRLSGEFVQHLDVKRPSFMLRSCSRSVLHQSA